jgi:hypothetical protein
VEKSMNIINSKLIKIIVGFVLVISVYTTTHYNDLLFKYYLWHLSSESPSEREKYANKIIELGEDVVPDLIDRLDNPYVFEIHHILNALESIIETKEGYPISQEEQIRYWQLWWSKNKQDY